MNTPAINININNTNFDSVTNIPINKHPTSYREVKVGKTLYRVTSIFKGEKELGATLEKLAIRHILDEMDGRAKELLSA